MLRIKTLLFGTGLMDPTITGKKCVTIRRFRPEAHHFMKNEVVIGIFEEGLNILISMTAGTGIKTFAKLTDKEAQGSGFKDAKDAFEGLKKFYTDLKKGDIAAVIRYEVLKVKGIPVISFPKTIAE